MLDEFTRRAWILRLGGATVLSGVSGAVLDAAEEPKLPPGLYQPSLQHLAHSLKAATSPRSLPFPPQYFAAEDYNLIQDLVSLVLGEEPSTPPVPEITVWIDMIVGRSAEVCAAARALSATQRRLAMAYYGQEAVLELETEEPQRICRDGLAALKREGFQALDQPAQLARLADLEKSGNSFLAWIKRRTLDGFYTSKEGLQELDYKGNASYAESPGCKHQQHGGQ